MADDSGISWCDATFNPWIGCAKVSPACAHCYAETLTTNRMGLHVWGEDAARRVAADSTWRNPLRWARYARDGRLPNGKENRDGHRPRVFCASLADVFEERPDLDDHRVRLFDLILRTPELDWLILTKRPEYARAWFGSVAASSAVAHAYAHHFEDGDNAWDYAQMEFDRGLGNVWMGVSIENARFTWRADVLRQIPAAIRFISAEPLLGSLFQVPGRDPDEVLPSDARAASQAGSNGPSGSPTSRPGRAPLNLTGIDWVIVGGESGPRAKTRPMHPSWPREIRDAVLAEGHEPEPLLAPPWTRPALHFKQWGSHDADGVYRGAAPKSGGKLLDGIEWCEFPDPSDRLAPV